MSKPTWSGMIGTVKEGIRVVANDPSHNCKKAFSLAQNEYVELREWLFNSAFPLWGTVGCDKDSGGFFEKIGKDVHPIDALRRTRVVCRQIFSFAAAGRMGWPGDSAGAVAHGLRFLRQHCFQPNGSVRSATDLQFGQHNEKFDLYDHAFALFGLCAAYHVLPEKVELADKAVACLVAMKTGWGHYIAGFEEASPSVLPLRSNPHMHILEACLAWAELGPEDKRSTWLRQADEIAELCLSRFICVKTGAVREYYDHDWNVDYDFPLAPVEPGHQFEWAWLLAKWGKLRGEKKALKAARRLVEIGEENGVCPNFRIAINGLDHNLEPVDKSFRLWPQTERIKAWLILAELSVAPDDREFALGKVAEAGKGLKLFLSDVPDGLWRDRLTSNGTTIEEPVPASSLYHIVCAVEELYNFFGERKNRRPALFLDRDGVIVKDIGYPGKIENIDLIEGAADAIRNFNERDFHVFVVTNQSGIGRGYYDEDDYNVVRAHIKNVLRKQCAHIDDERASPFFTDAIDEKYRRYENWRKPNAGMIVDLMQEWNIDLEHSILVGDKISDIHAANAVGLKAELFEGGSLSVFLESLNLLGDCR
ncbi:HAD-IIIA family hydrolase [Agrobacterium sp. NPDC058088]|uniref:HAD-IIIA family hydrolase n=1 Tax=Agrobacterium sp. NPDC058088 TaxID=3346335 RepID=UPI0036D90822